MHLPPLIYFKSRLACWSTLKIAIIGLTYFYILLSICYFFSHLIGLFCLTWLYLSYIRLLDFFFILCFSLTKGLGSIETLHVAIYSQRLYLNTANAAHMNIYCFIIFMICYCAIKCPTCWVSIVTTILTLQN